jgi:predicted nucleic acid-binding protein
MIIVLDASVVLKWLIGDPLREPDTDKAAALIRSLVEGELEVLQPVHWLAEVAAVAARLTPTTAVRDVELLTALEFPTADSPNVIARATSLAIETKHHLFDTLYHAVALEHADTMLVTADARYCAKAERYGMITSLRDWKLPTN